MSGGAESSPPVWPERPEDRWGWRRKIRANAHRRRIYRMVVGLAGLLLIMLGLVTGPLPGPGGIPLILLGLAVWASEFAWAHRLMLRFKHALHVFRGWRPKQQALAGVAFFAGCGLLGYGYLLTVGPPAWLPAEVDLLLARLPGV